MRAGWMRPCLASFAASAGRLAAHRVEARQDHGLGRVVDDEVHAVTDSNALMLRPSRPMIRPFMSSLFGSATR